MNGAEDKNGWWNGRIELGITVIENGVLDSLVCKFYDRCSFIRNRFLLDLE